MSGKQGSAASLFWAYSSSIAFRLYHQCHAWLRRRFLLRESCVLHFCKRFFLLFCLHCGPEGLFRRKRPNIRVTIEAQKFFFNFLTRWDVCLLTHVWPLIHSCALAPLTSSCYSRKREETPSVFLFPFPLSTIPRHAHCQEAGEAGPFRCSVRASTSTSTSFSGVLQFANRKFWHGKKGPDMPSFPRQVEGENVVLGSVRVV